MRTLGFCLGVAACVLFCLVSGCGSRHVSTVADFQRLAESSEGRDEKEVIQMFGRPSRLRHKTDYFIYAYDFPTSSRLWDTECSIRFNAATRRVEGWQLNSD